MPIVETLDYEDFDYHTFDSAPLSLDEAVKEQGKLRLTREGEFHRIVPVNRDMTAFRIDSTPKLVAYHSMWAKFIKRLLR